LQLRYAQSAGMIRATLMTPHPGGLSLGGGSRYFRAVLDSLLDAVVIADVHGVVWGYNEGARRLFGYAPGEVVGGPIGLLMPPSCWRPELAFVDRPSDEDGRDATRQHVEGRRKDGTRYCCRLDITGFAIDGQRYLVGVAREQAEAPSPGGVTREALQDTV
jgi:PAS domain S-box-containing protein